MRICALVPAAGKGTRLGVDVPKILVPVDGERTVWTILRQILTPCVEHIHVVLSPTADALFNRALKPEQVPVSTSIQYETKGMGDAIFGASSSWKDYDSLMIVWGDQVNLSAATIEKVAAACNKDKQIVLPLTTMADPYVQYDFEDAQLVRVRQSREGDVMDARGASDVGLFVLSVNGLQELWSRFLHSSPPGTITGEINFLPFLPYLCRQGGWDVTVVDIPDHDEARGINTPDDLEFARTRLR